MTCEPTYSAQAQSRKVKESQNKSFGLVGHHCLDITRNEAECITHSVVQLLLTYGPFYKNVTTCGLRRQNDV